MVKRKLFVIAFIMVAIIELFHLNAWAEVDIYQESETLYAHNMKIQNEITYSENSEFVLEGEFGSDIGFISMIICDEWDNKMYFSGSTRDENNNFIISSSMYKLSVGNYYVNSIYLHGDTDGTGYKMLQYNYMEQDDKSIYVDTPINFSVVSNIDFVEPSLKTFRIKNGKKTEYDTYDVYEFGLNEKIDFEIECDGTFLSATISIEGIGTDHRECMPIVSPYGASCKMYRAGEYRITAVYLNPFTEQFGGGNQLDYLRGYSLVDGKFFDAWYGPVDFVRFNNEKEIRLSIVDTDSKKNNLQQFSLTKQEAKLSEKVFIDMITINPVKEGTLIFDKDDGSESLIVTLTNTNEKPYFTIPFTAIAGTYNLNYLILKDYNGVETQYRSGEEYLSIKHFDFNSSLTIIDEYADTDLLHLENDKITDSVIQKIKELDDNVVVEITADQETEIRSEIFDAIKGTGKTLRIKYDNVEWLFNGKDIQESKSIDVRVWVYGLYNDEMYGGAVKKGLRLEFANNGKLPGKCLIRVKNNSTVEQYLNGKKSYVYFYDEKTDSFEKIAMQINCINGEYYEFYISHNSVYVMTTEEIGDEYLTTNAEKTDDLELNGGEKKSILPNVQDMTIFNENGELDVNTIIKCAIVVVCALILIIVMISWVFPSKKKNNNNNE